MKVTHRAWVVRAGRNGEREAWALEQGVTGGGYAEVPDLSAITDAKDVRAAIEQARPNASVASISNLLGGLWALRERMRTGDLVVMPMKSTGTIAIGTVAGPYEYRVDPDEDRRHTRPVHWARADVPRTAIRQDLLYTLNGARTIFECTRNDAAWRLGRVLETGADPGARTGPPNTVTGYEDADLGDPAPAWDLERIGRDAITQAVSERFKGHRLAELVAAILEARAFRCDVSPLGPDRGVDVYASCGPLGLDPPRIVAQVKSDASPVGAPVVQQLQGAMAAHGADQALLVAWGGVTRQARQVLESQQFRIRVWDADDLVDELCHSYARLPEELRAELPLQQVWTVVPEAPDDL